MLRIFPQMKMKTIFQIWQIHRSFIRIKKKSPASFFGVKFLIKRLGWYLLSWLSSANERGRQEKYFQHKISGRVRPKFHWFEFENENTSGSDLSYVIQWVWRSEVSRLPDNHRSKAKGSLSSDSARGLIGYFVSTDYQGITDLPLIG